VEVKLSETIADLKASIAKVTNIVVSLDIIRVNDAPQKDDQTIEESIVPMMERVVVECMPHSLKVQYGRGYSIQFFPCATVLDVKEKLHKKIGIVPAKQFLA
jgi:hypothetical protein